MSVDTSNNINLELLESCINDPYTINEDGSIDVDGNVELGHRNLTKIPFKFRHIHGSFYCYNNRLTSLEGAPINVGGVFDCGYNELTSLDGAPNSVGSIFRCDYNKLASLDGAPNFVGDTFRCCFNLNLPYSELFKIVDRVKGIYYSSMDTPEDKDKIRRDRDVKNVLKDDDLGNLDV